MSKIFHLTRVPDTKLLAFYKEITDQSLPERASFEAMDAIRVAHSPECTLPSDLARLFKATTYLIDSASYRCPSLGLDVIFRRGHQYTVDRAGNASWSRGNPFVDAIEINGPSEPNGPNAIRVAQAIQRHLEMAPPIAFAESGQNALQQSSAILNQVSAAAAEIAAYTAERHRELDEFKQDLENRASASTEAARSSLEAEYRARVAKFEKREQELIARRRGQI